MIHIHLPDGQTILHIDEAERRPKEQRRTADRVVDRRIEPEDPRSFGRGKCRARASSAKPCGGEGRIL
jgi:hypothetical protein